MVAAHSQIGMLASAGVPPLVLPSSADQWFAQQALAAKAIAMPLPKLRGLLAVKQQLCLGGSAIHQKRKWQTTSTMDSSGDQHVSLLRASAMIAENSQAKDRNSTFSNAASHQRVLIEQAPAPLLQRKLLHDLSVEQHQALCLQGDVGREASNAKPLPIWYGDHNLLSDVIAKRRPVARQRTLQQLQEAAAVEHVAANRMIHLSLT
jgi:hypothetical protein